MIRFLMRRSFSKIKSNSFTHFAYLTSSSTNSLALESSQKIINETVKSISDKYVYFNLAKSKKTIQPILEAFLAANHETVKFLIKEPRHWSTFFAHQKEVIKPELPLQSFLHLMIIESICTLQSAATSNHNHEFYLQLAESFTTFLFKYSNLNLSETNIQFGYMKMLLTIHCIYFESLISEQKQSPHKLVESNVEIKSKLNRLEDYLKLLMKRYANFDAIPSTEKEIFIRAFSLFETKWLYSTNLLLSDINSDQNALYTQIGITNALKGAIRFNRMEIFRKLFVKLNEKNLNGKIMNVLFPHTSVYGEFFSLKGNNLENDLNDLLSGWQSASYVPSETLLNDLKEFIRKNRNEKCDYEIKNVQLTSRGLCKITGQQLKRKQYSKSDLDRVANLVRENILLESNSEKFLNSDALKEFDRLLEENRFEIIIDGMNLYYHNRQPRLTNITRMIEFIQLKLKKKNILILFKDHLKNHSHAIKTLTAQNPNVKCFYTESEPSEEDKFVLYASLRCTPNTYIVSNDTFSNFICRLNTSFDTFKHWLTNRRISYRISLKSETLHVSMPPLYEIKVHRQNEYAWFVPYKSDLVANNETTSNWIYIYNKNK